MGKRSTYIRRASRTKSKHTRKRGGAFYLTRSKLHGKRLSRFAPLSRSFCDEEMKVNRNNTEKYPTTSVGKLRHSILKRACYERFNPLKSSRMKLNTLDVGEKKIDELAKRIQALQRIKKKGNFGAFENAAKVEQQIADTRQKTKTEKEALQRQVKEWFKT